LLLKGLGLPAVVASVLGARRRRVQPSAFKYKKEEGLNRLISLDPKRHIQEVNRHDRSVNRQNALALLSFICQAPVCLVTKLEDKNDA